MISGFLLFINYVISLHSTRSQQGGSTYTRSVSYLRSWYFGYLLSYVEVQLSLKDEQRLARNEILQSNHDISPPNPIETSSDAIMPVATPNKTGKPSAKRRLLFTSQEKESGEKKRKVQVVGDVAVSPPRTSTNLLETPQKKASLGRGIVVTPDKGEGAVATSTKTTPGEEEYVPTYIHKNLSYQRRGDATLKDKVKQTFGLVEAHFTIPSDFEQSRKYGPIGGTCHEERAIQAYNLSLLEPIKTENSSLEICSECAVLGHKRNDCSTLI